MDSLDYDLVDRTLSNVLDESIETVMIEISHDYNDVELEAIRDRYYDIAKSRILETCNNLFGPLAQRGKSEKPTALRLIKRTGNNKSMTLCKDICDLYLYANNHVDDFPRSVLSSTSFLPDVKKAKRETMEIRVQSENRDNVIRLEAKVKELNAKIVEVESNCDKVIMSHKKQIDVLEAEVHNMSTILDQLLLSINVPKSPTCIESRSDTAASKPINATALHSTQNIAMKSVNCNDRSNTQVTNQPDKHDTGSKTGAKQTVYTPDEGSKSGNKQTVVSSNPSKPREPEIPISYKSAVQRGSSSGKRLTNNPASPPTNNTASASNGRNSEVFTKLAKKPVKPLTGLKFERTKTVYVSNIRMDFNDEDDDVIDRVKSHATSINLNIIKIVVVHNRFNRYRVGCKMDIPESGLDDALDSENWPHPIECRVWTRFKTRGSRTDTTRRQPDRQSSEITTNLTRKKDRTPSRDDIHYQSHYRSEYEHDSNGIDHTYNRHDDTSDYAYNTRYSTFHRDERNQGPSTYSNDDDYNAREYLADQDERIRAPRKQCDNYDSYDNQRPNHRGHYDSYNDDTWDYHLQDNGQRYHTRYPASTDDRADWT
ncbi:unnamed protein product [Owenia fusiformis]|uniref:Uncharacterized protein n=1 Tax=Owenia fusiformis TaxID=6347 RepID=A0A8S4QBQ9_OWEFU|nr:unnamed protein product [Owenia fusiformis]